MATNTENRAPRPGGRPEGFQLKKFPKEFEKSFFAGIDMFFTTVASISIIVLFSSFLFLSANALKFFGLSDEELAARTQKLVQRIYKVEDVEPEVVEEEKPLEEEVPDDRQKEIEERKKNVQQNTQLSAAQKAQNRREEAQKRREQREAQRQQLASSAQLALITGGANASGEAVTDVLGDASSNLNLDDALKNTSGISIAQNSGSKTRIVQGSRQSGSGNVDDLVSDIGGMSSTSLSSRKLDIDFGEVDLGSAATTKSGRTNEELNGKLREIKPAVENCFKQEKRLNPNLKGSLKVVFSVNARGQVRTVSIAENTLKNSKVEDCIKQKFRTLRFPAAKDDITASTRYLFE